MTEILESSRSPLAELSDSTRSKPVLAPEVLFIQN